MVLPDGLTNDELAKHGFTKVSDRKAKHSQHQSYRSRCENCELWFKQLESVQGKMLCRDCRKNERPR